MKKQPPAASNSAKKASSTVAPKPSTMSETFTPRRAAATNPSRTRRPQASSA
jgi:hypothetical protein